MPVKSTENFVGYVSPNENEDIRQLSDEEVLKLVKELEDTVMALWIIKKLSEKTK